MNRKPFHKTQNTLIIEFAKYPKPGYVKTRLAAKLGYEAACRIYNSMAQKTHYELLTLQENGIARVIVYGDGAERKAISRWLKDSYDIWLQPQGELGQRLQYAFLKAFEKGFQTVLAVGTDCPGLTSEKIQEAIGRLAHADVVIIPSEDGGYVLIGARSLQTRLFEDIPWSSGRVLEQTVMRAREHNLSIAQLEPEIDVDTLEDLKKVEHAIAPEVSVIIPVLNDRYHLEKTLAVLSAANITGEFEIIVVDGGSSDGSGKAAIDAGARLLNSLPGRARQMNLGARNARGRWLWFLHADCQPDPETVVNLPSYLLSTRLVWGFFRQRIADASPWYRLIEVGNRLRGQILRLPYGDQGVIVRRDVFHACGGFPDTPFLEDVMLSRSLSKICRPKVASGVLLLSARHWKPLGTFLTTIRNVSLIFRLLALRQSPQHLRQYFLKWRKNGF